jgi:hypothetical protein
MPQGLPVSVRNYAAMAWAKAFNSFCPIKDGFQVPPRALLPLPRGEFAVAASDCDAGAVHSTEANALRAGVPSLPSIVVGTAATQNAVGRQFALWTTHQSRSYRAAKHPLLPLYHSLGNHINKNLERKRSMGTILLTDDRELLRHGGFDRPFTTVVATTHGGIPVLGMSLQSSTTALVPEVLSDAEDTKEPSKAAA